MVKHLCVYCSTVKDEDEFYPTNLSRCKTCLRAYNKEWRLAHASDLDKRKRKPKARIRCQGCDKVMNKPVCIICEKCSRNEETRKKFDILTASDVQLKDDDYFHNAMAFIVACGRFDDFVEKAYSAEMALCDEMKLYDRISEGYVNEHVLDLYEEKLDNFYVHHTLKTPGFTVKEIKLKKLRKAIRK